MKREFSFYEFVGILVPSVTLLCALVLMYHRVYGKAIVLFSSIGESVVFLIVAYGLGHIIQAIGNYFEKALWHFTDGMPTAWLTDSKRQKRLFGAEQATSILERVHSVFGISKKDFGSDVYNWLSIKAKVTEKRIDVFGGNYAMFRGLSIAFYLISIALLFFNSLVCFIWLPVLLGLISTLRMYHFGVLYAKEVYRTFQNLNR